MLKEKNGCGQWRGESHLGGGNSNIFWNFHPDPCGKWSNLTFAYFSNGLKLNHQLENERLGSEHSQLELPFEQKGEKYPTIMDVLKIQEVPENQNDN